MALILDSKFVQNGVRMRSVDPFYWRKIFDYGITRIDDMIESNSYQI